MAEGKRRVEAMCLEDLDEVLAIEASGHPRPWTRAIFEQELEREMARLVVLRQGESTEVLAFCNYWLVHDELHLLNIVIHPRHRRRGHGRFMMEELVAVARREGCRCITLEVRVGNAGAIALYEDLGFVRVGLRPNYYAEEKEDALVMLLELADDSAAS